MIMFKDIKTKHFHELKFEVVISPKDFCIDVEIWKDHFYESFVDFCDQYVDDFNTSIVPDDDNVLEFVITSDTVGGIIDAYKYVESYLSECAYTINTMG
ncbi:hypothetical protein [Aeromonas phage AS-yj]|uniref:Uncharacterized protein n=6 Tax=Caudoviricetes TaxID=2731619 RepID=A0A291LDY8_9CAUD|nr:hypothetical protein HWB28_gp105 [Aeromonas phage AS-zj]YP_009835040.1 hypothetical protein HWB29_gp338 [Aeromonas phage AS-sw]ATI17550.1 hypothetical protein [Aeromonas phage AS-szw]ATI17958.1 hypothetical protein [Aeromonas phage AS-yj]QAX97991.1 hypothetical protein ASswx1_350 [Aeromonas phage Asswx_1]QAX98966.1 hypothetical protein assk_175 [Aeromonas phage Assk]QMV28917.1 hypothetical protein AP1_0210 [Aeromonas phage AP1]